jgi:hypothetical protein
MYGAMCQPQIVLDVEISAQAAFEGFSTPATGSE